MAMHGTQYAGRPVRVSRMVVASRPLADAPIALQGPSSVCAWPWKEFLCGVAGALNQASVHSLQSTQLPQRCRSLAIAKLLKVKATHSTPPQANGIFKTSTAMRAVCSHSTCFHLVHWFRLCTALEYRTRACVHFNCIQMPLLRHAKKSPSYGWNGFIALH